MSKLSIKKNIDRIIDANLNRANEGLRVCEEIARFILEDRRLTTELKTLRHAISSLVKEKVNRHDLLCGRQSKNDIGKKIYLNELKRLNPEDIFYANIQRVKESLRVLEEFSKISDSDLAVSFKNIRFNSYAAEKNFNRLLPKFMKK